MYKILPIITMTTEEQFSEFIHDRVSRNQKIKLQLGIRSSVDILTNLDKTSQDRLTSSVLAGDIHIYPDSLNFELHGLMNINVLEKSLRKASDQFKLFFPETECLFFPKWHDYSRSKVGDCYRKILGNFLIPVNRHVYSLHRKNTSSEDTKPNLVPYIEVSGTTQRQCEKQILQNLKRSKSLIKRCMASKNIATQQDWETIVCIDASSHSMAISALEALVKKGRVCTANPKHRDGLRSTNTQGTDSRNSHNLCNFDDRNLPVLLDPNYYGPEFLTQFFREKKRSKSINYSLLGNYPVPNQPIDPPTNHREITSNTMGSVSLYEGDLKIDFLGGSMTALLCAGEEYRVSLPSIMQVGRRRSVKAVETAFAIEGLDLRGIRQIHSLKMPAMQIAGRIVNDYLLIDSLKELYLDSFIHHPWLWLGKHCDRYIPQMLCIDIGESDSCMVSSQNSDGTMRNFTIRHNNKGYYFLPGSAWIINWHLSSMGIELVYGKRMKINMPSTVQIAKIAQHRYCLHFLPNAEYRSPKSDILNGIMEHYTLRIVPGIKNFDSIGSIDPLVYSLIDPPKIAYY